MTTLEAPGGPRVAADRERAAGWPVHVAAVLLLFLVLAVRYAEWLSYPGVLNDEISYARAAGLVAAGRSPYYGGYLYPPLVASAVAAAREAWGLLPVLVTLRVANFLGLALVTWLAFLPLAWPLSRRWLAGALFLVLAPSVHFSVLFSNLSATVVALIAGALVAWPRAPLAAGLLLGASLAIKPLAPGALVVLGAHRPLGGGARHLATVGLALLAAALLLLPFPYLGEMLSLTAAPAAQLARSVSPHRIAYLLGWRDNILPLSAGILLVAALLAHRRPLPPLAVGLWASVVAIAATPVVWSHTLLLTLPLQVLALDRAWRRWRQAWGTPLARRQTYEAVLVLLAVAGIQLAQGAQGIYDRALPLQLAGAAVPAFAPALLAAYVLRRVDQAPC